MRTIRPLRTVTTMHACPEGSPPLLKARARDLDEDLVAACDDVVQAGDDAFLMALAQRCDDLVAVVAVARYGLPPEPLGVGLHPSEGTFARAPKRCRPGVSVLGSVCVSRLARARVHGGARQRRFERLECDGPCR